MGGDARVLGGSARSLPVDHGMWVGCGAINRQLGAACKINMTESRLNCNPKM